MDGRVSIPWTAGTGNIAVEATEVGARVSSDTANAHLARSQSVTFRTLEGNVRVVRRVRQAGQRVLLRDKAGRTLRDGSQKLLTARKDG